MRAVLGTDAGSETPNLSGALYDKYWRSVVVTELHVARDPRPARKTRPSFFKKRSVLSKLALEVSSSLASRLVRSMADDRQSAKD